MNQCEKILQYMAFRGPITTFESFNILRITRLPSRINELRNQGYDIADEYVTRKHLDGSCSTFKRYWLRNEEDRKELRERYKHEHYRN